MDRRTRSSDDDSAGADTSIPGLIGARVRVLARRGYSVEGVCLDAWRLHNGGTALKIKPSDGSPPREVTTLSSIVIVAEASRKRRGAG